jgi:hypothetical protein
MSRLESEAKPILTPMILGHRTGLTADQQAIVAKWMMLKVLFFDLVEVADQTTSDQDFKNLYTQQMPPARFEMWIARYAPTPLDIFSHTRNSFRTKLSHNGIPANTPHAQNLTLVFGHLVLQSIFINERTVAYPPVFQRREPEPHISRIWPTERTVDWPPPFPLSAQDIDSFATGINSDGSPA